MKRKNKDEDLIIAENGWGMLDNLGDKIIEDTITGFSSDLLTSVPMGGVVIGLYKGLRRANELKKYKNFISFIRSYKTNTEQQIHQYLNENPTSELGDYTLSMIEDLSSPRQTEMLGKAAALLLNKIINENTFFEYGHIIKGLDPHLMRLLGEVGELYDDGVSATHNSAPLLQYNLVIQEKNPIQNSEDKYEYKASELGKSFYMQIVK